MQNSAIFSLGANTQTVVFALPEENVLYTVNTHSFYPELKQAEEIKYKNYIYVSAQNHFISFYPPRKHCNKINLKNSPWQVNVYTKHVLYYT